MLQRGGDKEAAFPAAQLRECLGESTRSMIAHHQAQT